MGQLEIKRGTDNSAVTGGTDVARMQFEALRQEEYDKGASTDDGKHRRCGGTVIFAEIMGGPLSPAQRIGLVQAPETGIVASHPLAQGCGDRRTAAHALFAVDVLVSVL